MVGEYSGRTVAYSGVDGNSVFNADSGELLCMGWVNFNCSPTFNLMGRELPGKVIERESGFFSSLVSAF